jgi:hypothetical protein
MTINKYLEQRLAGIQQALMAHHVGGISMPSASKGGERETFVRDFLQALFPAHRRFGQGAITDSKGNISGQVDIVLEFGHAPSFPMPNGDERLFLADAVAMAIEVKSDLTAQWEQVRSTTKKVKALHRNLGVVMAIGSNPPMKIPCIAIGYKGRGTPEELTTRLLATPEDERPDAVLIVESGAAATFDGAGAQGVWGLYLICTIINACLTQVAHAVPDLLSYVDVTTVPSQTTTSFASGGADWTSLTGKLRST